MPTIQLIENDRLNPVFMGITGGIGGVISAVVGNLVLDMFRDEYPSHWKILDILNEPDWEDWRDFTALCAALRRDQDE